MGTKVKKIDWDVVSDYLIAGCSGAEIAAVIGMTPKTLYDRCLQENKIDFSDYKQDKQATGDSILRKVQFETATIDRDKSMQIWLGKQRLGQTDRQAVDHTTKGDKVEISTDTAEILKKLNDKLK